jgi:hypothetical protein
MNPFTFAAIAGILCLPATYSFSREGSIILSVFVVALLGVIGGAIAQRSERGSFRPWPLALAFVVGAVFSEVVAFGHYYITYGYQDPKISVGVSVSVIEFLVISIVGGFALLSAAYLTHSRITRRSKGRAASGAPLS